MITFGERFGNRLGVMFKLNHDTVGEGYFLAEFDKDGKLGDEIKKLDIPISEAFKRALDENIVGFVELVPNLEDGHDILLVSCIELLDKSIQLLFEEKWLKSTLEEMYIEFTKEGNEINDIIVKGEENG